MRINKLFKRLLNNISFALSSVEKESLNQISDELKSDTGHHHRVTQGTLADSLVQGEVTQEVKNLRWRTFKILDKSDKMIVNSLGIDKDGYHKLDIEKPTNIGTKVLLSKVKLDEYDDYPLEIMINNDDITLSTFDAVDDTFDGFNIEDIEKTISGDTATLGIINSNSHNAIKPEKPIKIGRALMTRFKLEDYTKKVNIRTISDDKKLLEFYVSKYPDKYNKTSKIFINTLKRAINNPRNFDTLDINSLTFSSYKTIGVKDFYKFSYNNLKFDKIIEFNGHFVIKFKCDVLINGEYLLEKYREEKLDEKYKNKTRK